MITLFINIYESPSLSELIFCPIAKVKIFWIYDFQPYQSSSILWKCIDKHFLKSYSGYLNIGLGNGFVPPGRYLSLSETFIPYQSHIPFLPTYLYL